MDAGVVAIHPDRLDALADALERVADDALRLRADAIAAVAGTGAGVPVEADDLGALSSRLRLLAADTRRRLAVIEALPWDRWPMPTSIALGRPVAWPSVAGELARRLAAAHPSDAEVPRLLARLLATTRDPYEAAAALTALGVDGFRRLYELAPWATTRRRGPEAAAGLEALLEGVTGMVVRASQTVDRPGGLDRGFVDELVGAPGPPPGDAPDAGHDRGGSTGLDQVSTLLTAAGAGEYLVNATRAAVNAGTGAVVASGSRLLGIAGGIASIGAALDGGDGGDVAGGLAGGALGIVAAVAGGPVGWIAAGLGLVVTVLAAGPTRARPAPRTYPDGARNPGGSHYTWTVDGAGVPVVPPTR